MAPPSGWQELLYDMGLYRTLVQNGAMGGIFGHMANTRYVNMRDSLSKCAVSRHNSPKFCQFISQISDLHAYHDRL